MFYKQAYTILSRVDKLRFLEYADMLRVRVWLGSGWTQHLQALILRRENLLRVPRLATGTTGAMRRAFLGLDVDLSLGKGKPLARKKDDSTCQPTYLQVLPFMSRKYSNYL